MLRLDGEGSCCPGADRARARAPEIARDLVIAPGTARKHFEHVYRKLGVASRPQAIARVLQQSAAVASRAPDAIRALFERFDVDDPVALYRLTGREAEILILAAAGDTNAEIAARLDVRPETVKTHLDHVYAKVGAAGRGRAAAHALALGMRAPPARRDEHPLPGRPPLRRLARNPVS
jgi:DNA-binding CsgD family transcriptional regulator